MVLRSWRDQLKENVGVYILGLLIGAFLTYIISELILRLSSHAYYMANHAAYYSEVDGGMRWIDLYHQIRTRVILVGIVASIVGVPVALRADLIGGKPRNPLRRFLKYFLYGFIGVLLAAGVGGGIAGMMYPIPSAYTQLESQVVFENHKLRMWFAVGGLAIFLAGSMAIDLKQSISNRRTIQQQRYDDIEQRYKSLLERIDSGGEPETEILSQYDISSTESIDKRTELLASFDSLIRRYEELLDTAVKLSEQHQKIPNELNGVEDAINEAQMAIKTGRQGDIGEISQRLAEYQRTLNLIEHREDLLERIRPIQQRNSVPRSVVSELMKVGTKGDISETNLKRNELILDIAGNIIEMETYQSDVRTQHIWDQLFGDEENRNHSNLNRNGLENLLKFTQLALRILSFTDHNETEYTGIDNQELVDEINDSIAEINAERLNSRVNQIQNIEDRIWTIEMVQSLEWAKFEYIIGSLWQNKGYETKLTQKSADKGIDVLAVNDKERIAIQAKRYSQGNKVGNRTVRSTAGVLPRNFDKVVIVTTSIYSTGDR